MLETSGYKVDFPVEVRFVAGDDIWLSPSYGRPTAYIGIIRYKPYGVEVEYEDYFRRYEEIMSSLGGRPHWAKDFKLRGDAGFAGIYPKWHDFKRLRDSVDPRGVFVNDFVRRTLGLPNVFDVPAAAVDRGVDAAPRAAPGSDAAAPGRGVAARVMFSLPERDSDVDSAPSPQRVHVPLEVQATAPVV